MSASDISAGYCSWAYDFQVDVRASKFSCSFPFCGRFPKCPRALIITTCAKAPAASDDTEYSLSLLRFCKVPATDAGFDVAAARFYTTGQLHEQEFQKTCTRRNEGTKGQTLSETVSSLPRMPRHLLPLTPWRPDSVSEMRQPDAQDESWSMLPLGTDDLDMSG